MILRAMRFLGALAILAVGAIHLQQYLGADYRRIPTVGTLFLLNAVGAGIVGIGLLAPLGWLSTRRAPAATGLLALSAVAIALGSLVALFISESTSLFGFSESGYGVAIVVAIITEAATIALLAPVATASLVRARSHRRGPSTRPTGSRGSRLDVGAAR